MVGSETDAMRASRCSVSKGRNVYSALVRELISTPCRNKNKFGYWQYGRKREAADNAAALVPRQWSPFPTS